MRKALALLAVCSTLAPAYYHWTRFPSRTGPLTPMYDRFDLTLLPDGKTVQFFVTDLTGAQFAPGDSQTALISQLRAAARTWNSVETSELKLGFGGFVPTGTTMSTPWIEVEITDELPPGIVAMGGPVVRSAQTIGVNGPFTPIVKSLLRLPKNMSERPSWSERLFLTLVHEFGHTVGLQHSWTSGVMSTEITRATSKSRPLSADDIAGLSVLYPTASFRKNTGVISGRVTLNSQGVNLASVVAYSRNKTAVSTLTLPDGTYRIEGLEPGDYTVYAHPLPPALPGEAQPVNIDLPSDPIGRLQPGFNFDLQFWPGTNVPQATIGVQAEQTTFNVNFNVRLRDRVNLHSIQTYSFFGQEAVKPATFMNGMQNGRMYFTGYGATVASPNLSVSVVDGNESIVSGSLTNYASGYLQADIAMGFQAAEGPRNLLFRFGDESYMLPSAFRITALPPPLIASVTALGDGSVAVMGANLSMGTQIIFDGAEARNRSFDGTTLTVVPPPGPFSHRAAVVALNPDGQSSLMVQGNNTSTYTYESGDFPVLSLNSPTVTAGVDSLLEIDTQFTNLLQGSPSLLTNASEILVRGFWPVSATRAVAIVSVTPDTPARSTQLLISNGLSLSPYGAALQVLPQRFQPYVPAGQIPQAPVQGGVTLNLPIRNLSQSTPLANFSVTVGGRPVLAASFVNGTLGFQVPSGLPAGPAIVRISAGAETVQPTVVVIAAPEGPRAGE